MESFTISQFYFLCMMLGICWAILSSVLAGGHEAGGHDPDSGDSGLHFLDQLLGHAGDGHGSPDADHSPAGGADSPEGTMAPSPFSPLFLAVMATSFGAIGLLLTNAYRFSAAQSFAGALFISLLLAWYVSKLFIRIFIASQTDSLTESTDAIGEIGEVVVPIPQGGTGSVCYFLKGKRLTAPAISREEAALERGKKVVLTEFDGNRIVVRSAGETDGTGV